MAVESIPFAEFSDGEVRLLPSMANRHGLIAGATGTGKTVSLQVLAEGFSRIGVPVFLADVKGDLSGISRPGASTPKLEERLARMKVARPEFAGSPAVFWDVFGEQGHPARATVSDMGPLLLSRLLNLNEVQGGVLTLVFRVADDGGLLLLDFKDLREMVRYVGDHAGEFETEYGRVSTASIGAIQRGLLTLEEQGGDKLFGEPALNLDDLMQTDASGRGVVNVLAADKLMTAPRAYATFLLWLLAELFERLPEVGDREAPRLVLFFDEAHLLFDEAPAALLDKIEQVVRLIRSKGVGVFFVTQNPLDIPDITLSQLGNRVEHALRAFTPRDQKAVKAAATTFRANPKMDTEKAITELAVGEALVSFLDEKGQPSVVERAMVLPPKSRIGGITPDERREAIRGSVLYGTYEKAVDRESAYEMLKKRAEEAARAAEEAAAAPAPGRGDEGWARGGPAYPRTRPQPQPQYEPQRGPWDPAPRAPRRAGGRDTLIEAMAKSAARSIGSTMGRQILRGVLGSILGGGRR